MPGHLGPESLALTSGKQSVKPGPLASGPREVELEARKKSRSRAGSSDPWRHLAPGGSMDSWGKPEPLGGSGQGGRGGPKNGPPGTGTGLKQTIHFLYA